ncbi:transcription repressor NadR [Calidifontibacillus oryziterrae]|uniref:transcription repressor NadR n=1 Tax=Calidifontibacillus oryziterrae TaxID=1191699 RepID=UPI0002D70A6C|nr:transcription repressor NadR [Calidifontibacillus oryziterrae]
MAEGKKILGDERRNLILHLLKQENKPLTGGFLAEKTNVSRQVICQDITLLKAKHEPIIATSQGYIYLRDQAKQRPSKVIACIHAPEQTKEELQLLVDCGVTVKDVKIEHPHYGELTAAVMVSNRNDVEKFLEKFKVTNAALLSELTGGIHFHTLEADRADQIENAIERLDAAGFLVK